LSILTQLTIAAAAKGLHGNREKGSIVYVYLLGMADKNREAKFRPLKTFVAF
jgi:hypothetical protein